MHCIWQSCMSGTILAFESHVQQQIMIHCAIHRFSLHSMLLTKPQMPILNSVTYRSMYNRHPFPLPLQVCILLRSCCNASKVMSTSAFERCLTKQVLCGRLRHLSKFKGGRQDMLRWCVAGIVNTIFRFRLHDVPVQGLSACCMTNCHVTVIA